MITLFGARLELTPANLGMKGAVDKANEILENAGWKKKGLYREKDGIILSIDMHYIGIDPKQKAIAESRPRTPWPRSTHKPANVPADGVPNQ